LFAAWCGQLQHDEGLPRSAMTSLDKASTGVALNIAEGNGKFSLKDRCRFIGHARTAALQAAATLDVFVARKIMAKQYVSRGKSCLVDIVRMLVAWERNLGER
jgi:four helix bundle protein